MIFGSKAISFILFSAFLFTTIACHEKKQLQEMHAAALDTKNDLNQMKESTAKVEENSAKTNENTEKIVKLNEESNEKIQSLATQTEASAVAQQSIQSELNQSHQDQKQQNAKIETSHFINSIKSATSRDGKISAAVQYLTSFEFQTSNAVEMEKREILFNEALVQFFQDLNEFNDKGTEINPFADPSGNTKDQKASAFNALAVSLQAQNRKQMEIKSINPDFTPTSFLKLIMEGLSVESQIQLGLKQEQNVQSSLLTVLHNKKLALSLLQARVNFFTYAFLVETVGFENSFTNNFLKKWKSWELNLKDIDSFQFKKLKNYLMAISETKAFLKSLKIKVEVKSPMNSILENMKIVNGDILGIGTEEKLKFIDLVKDLKL